MNFLTLIVQKDTLENDKVKSIVRSCDGDVHNFVQELQTGHCIEYQLLAYGDSGNSSEDLISKVTNLIKPFKTNYGKDWYEFDHDVLAKIISLFLDNGISTVNLKCISNIMGFSLKLFPIVTREVKVSSLSDNVEAKEELISILGTLDHSKITKSTKSTKKTKKEV